MLCYLATIFDKWNEKTDNYSLIVCYVKKAQWKLQGIISYEQAKIYEKDFKKNYWAEKSQSAENSLLVLSQGSFHITQYNNKQIR